MGISNLIRRSRIRRVSQHRLFHTDKSYGFEFYYKFTKDNDLTIMAFDIVNKTYREFILDDALVSAMFQVSDGNPLKANATYVKDKITPPTMVDDYVKAGFTILKTKGASKFANVVVLAKLGDFGKDRSKALILRRVVYNETLIIGLDTLALPLNAVKAFVKTMEIYFKKEKEFTTNSLKKINNKGTK
jgi:hypothetical protein